MATACRYKVFHGGLGSGEGWTFATGEALWARRVVAAARSRPAHTANHRAVSVFEPAEKACLRAGRFHIPQGVSAGKPIGQAPLPRAKAEAIKAELAKGTDIIKTAALRHWRVGSAAHQEGECRI
jgi:hypothetical protein